ncbi:MAG TPA: glycosyltransferase [Nocardioidaceae bacterium]|nr:glycosyltransferase [Nocardioidaceae bacterium]
MTLEHPTGGQPGGQPRVRGNDWPSLGPPPLGGWRPTLSVTVVVPAHQAAATLPLTLASLAVQTYPEDLLEVVVVDDASSPPVSLPELRPARTRLVPTTGSWGRGHACHVGALAAEGEVLHWLDADMVLHRDQVEAQLRWHHVLDHAVVLGTKTFVDAADGLPDPAEVARLVAEGRPADLFPGRWTAPHEWVEDYLASTEQLTRNPTKSYLVHTGACASVGRALYLRAGGLDDELKLGEDVELGYRLAQRGAVFVPDRDACSWHLGRSTLMQRQETVNRYNRPFVTDRMPDLRHWRAKRRSYTVPWVQAVVEADGHPFAEARASVEGALTGSVADVEVLVVGPWSRLTGERRSPLTDPDGDLRLLRAEFRGEPRVRFVEDVPDTAFPATFRLRLPTGWAPGPDSLRRLALEMTRRDLGLVSLLLPDGCVARLERTSAVNRALTLLRVPERPARGPTTGGTGPESVDDLVDQVSGSWWFEGAEEGFVRPAAPQAPPAGEQAGGTAPAAPARPRPGRPGRGAARRADLQEEPTGPPGAAEVAGPATREPPRRRRGWRRGRDGA